MSNFKNLTVWKKSYQLSVLIYQKTQHFPKHEQYGLTSQMRRAAVSISANIAEGSARNSDRTFAHFINIAQGSLAELRCFFDLALEFKYLTQDDYQQLTDCSDETGRLLGGFFKKLKANC